MANKGKLMFLMIFLLSSAEILSALGMFMPSVSAADVDIKYMYRCKKGNILPGGAAGIIWVIESGGNTTVKDGEEVYLIGPKDMEGTYDTKTTVKKGKFKFVVDSGSNFAEGDFKVKIKDKESDWKTPTDPPKKGKVRGTNGQIWPNVIISVIATRLDTNTVNVPAFYALIDVRATEWNQTENMAIIGGARDVGQDIVLMLGAGDEKTGETIWNEYGVPYGYYQISAEVVPISTRSYTLYDNVSGNNAITYGTIEVLPPGEVSGDENGGVGSSLWVVDGVDVIMLIEKILLTTPRFDLNRDGIVDGQDVVPCIELVPTVYTHV